MKRLLIDRPCSSCEVVDRMPRTKGECTKCYLRWYRTTVQYKEQRRIYLDGHRDQIEAFRREYQRKPIRRFNQSVCKARIMSKTWTIDLDSYLALIAQPCYYCGGKLNETAAGLDRIDNSIGYELNNVLPCCDICNRTRGKYWSVEETKIMIAAIKAWRSERVEKVISELEEKGNAH